MKIFSVFVFTAGLLLAQCGFGQDTESHNFLLSYSERQSLYFFEYAPALQIKADYTDVIQADNLYPEQLMQSILSARNQAWVDYNSLGGAATSQKMSDNHFQKIVSMDKAINYFELIHKMTFNVGTVPTALVKFYFHQENAKPASGCVVMQFVEGRWQKTSDPSLSMLSIALMRIKTNVMQGVLYGNSGDPEIDALRQRVSVNGTFDLARFEKEFSSWYAPTKNKARIVKFVDSNSW
jgi:hypothetical protein